MILGIGVDIELIKRFKESCTNKNFLDLIFTKKEIEYCKKYTSFAGKFCAKEAVIKAYPKKISFKDIEIINSESGKIKVNIHGRYDKNIHCSVSHTKDYALSFVIISK